MTEIPYLTNAETQQTAFPAMGTGGSDVILVIGKTAEDADTSKIFEFYSYWEAQRDVADGGLGALDIDNQLLQGVLDVYTEGSQFQSYQNPTISKVYAINVGPDPTKTTYEDAMAASVIKRDVDFELYLKNYDLTDYEAHMNAVATHLGVLENQNDYREAVFTLDPTMSIAEKADITDPTNVGSAFIKSNRVIIHENENVQARYAAKLACTNYMIEPSLDPYRSLAATGINEYKYDDLETLIAAGIVADYQTPTLNPDYINTATPVRSISTAHRKDAEGARALDTNTHVRRNVDYQWWYTDLIAQSELKYNNTETYRQHIINAVTDFFNAQVKLGSITPQLVAPIDPGFYVDVIPDSTDANKIHLLRRIRPVSATYFIEIDSVIQSPSLQAVPIQRLRAW